MAPLICWPFSSSIFRYLLGDRAVLTMCCSLAPSKVAADMNLDVTSHLVSTAVIHLWQLILKRLEPGMCSYVASLNHSSAAHIAN
jgi:hypothetical protein